MNNQQKDTQDFLKQIGIGTGRDHSARTAKSIFERYCKKCKKRKAKFGSDYCEECFEKVR